MPAHRIHPVVVRQCPICGQPFKPQPCDVARGLGLYCGRICSGMGRRKPRQPLAERFWAKVNKTDSCWLWTGGTNATGYGLIGKGGRHAGRLNLLAHRVSYELTIGPIPDGLKVCHNCPDGDNPLCVNPAHLFLGTTTDNALDMVRKGRRSDVRLSPSAVLQLRARHARGELAEDLARELGIHVTTCRDAIAGRTWKNVPLPSGDGIEEVGGE